MTFFKYLTIYFLAAFICCSASAQDAGDTVVSDEVSDNYADTVVASQDMNDAGLQSTAPLHLNRNYISKDSVLFLQNEKILEDNKKLDSILKVLKKEEMDKELLAERNPYKKSWLEKVFSSLAVKRIFAVLAIVFILAIVYKLFFAKGVFLRKTYSGKVFEVQADSNDDAKDDFAGLIKRAVAEKNFRLAVRYHFKQTLSLLAEKNHLVIGSDKTNYQYVRELRSSSIKNDFSALVMYYEYVWYGELEIDENVFMGIKNKFLTFNNQL